MPSRDSMLAMVREGCSYEEIGRRGGVPPGQAYLVVTGLPADGSDVLAPELLATREGLLEGSTQHLANPPTEVPTTDPMVASWMRARAQRDRRMQQAADRRTAAPPPVVGAEETDDVLSVLGWDHTQTQFLQEQLTSVPVPDRRLRRSILHMIRVRMSAHIAVEAAHFWPAVRQALDAGDSLADTGLAQGEQGLALLREIEGSDDAERFDELVERISLQLRKHVAFQDRVFLDLARAMPQPERDRLGRRIKQAKAPDEREERRPDGQGADS